MLQQIVNLVKENAGDLINNNPDIPVDKKEEAFQVAGASVADGLKGVLSHGGIKEVMKLFSGKSDPASNPVAEQASGTFANNLSSKLGLNSSQASGLASTIIPVILGKLVNKTNDPTDRNFDLQDMMNQFSGGKTAGIDLGAILGRFQGGLDKDGDGDVDLNDLKSMFGSGEGGGIADSIRGMFK